MAQLQKADMVAVLERTHLVVSDESFLLPLYESISNAIHAIQDRWGDQSSEKGQIDILFARDPKSDSYYFEVCDNGIGLTDENYNSFLVPFTGHKLRVNGKGFGRFVAFKVFKFSHYLSKYKGAGDVIKTRSFLFDVIQKEELAEDDRALKFPHETGCLVSHEILKPEYQSGKTSSDPVKQMLDTAGKIRETGNVRTASQKVINIENTATMYGYIVADLTPSLKAIAADNDFRLTWDKAGFYRYHETRDIFIEIISYDKLLADAKKRNALFFDVLMGDLTA